VLTYRLTQALRVRGVEHYVLRAAPDGEGDWAYEAARETVRLLRVKGAFTAEFVAHVCRSLAERHLPLLVDVGGRPSTEQERIFDYCTHAILLTRDPASHAIWLDLAERHGLPLVADLTSRLTGKSRITDAGPVLRGIITGLERAAPPARWERGADPVFDALVERVAAIFAYDADELRRMHRAMAPVELVIEVDRLLRTLGIPHEGSRWQPAHLPRVLDYVPVRTPLGLYGRGPNWLYAALALHAHPAPFYQFDVRLGWVAPPILRLGDPTPDAPLQVRTRSHPDHRRLDFTLSQAYLDYGKTLRFYVPPPPSDRGVVLGGKLPLWLWTALALVYRDASWLAVYQPQWGDRALVVHSRVPQPQLGDLIVSPP
jgi:CRISPR-associated protein Csx3